MAGLSDGDYRSVDLDNSVVGNEIKNVPKVEVGDDEKLSSDWAKKKIKELNTDAFNIDRRRKGRELSHIYFSTYAYEVARTIVCEEYPLTGNKKRIQQENFVKYISRLMSVIYKKPPTRVINNENGEIDEEQTEIVNQLYKKSRIDKVMKEIERIAKWARTVLCRAIYDTVDQKIYLKPFTPQYYDVITDRFGHLLAVFEHSYLENGKIEHTVCTKDKWFVFRQNGDRIKLISEKPNKVKMIPYVLFNDEEPIENERHYLHPDILMKKTNDNIMLELTDLLHLSKNCVFGQPYAIDVEDIPSHGSAEIMLELNSKTESDKQGHVGVLQSEADFDGIIKAINLILSFFSQARGLAPNTFSVDRKAPHSGVALKINNAPLVEMRESEEDKYRDFEFSLFEIVRAYRNLFRNKKNGHTDGEIKKRSRISVEFNRSDDAFESPAELRQQAAMEVHDGLLKPTDFVKMRFPSFTEEQCFEYLKQVVEQKKQLGFETDISSFPEENEIDDN